MGANARKKPETWEEFRARLLADPATADAYVAHVLREALGKAAEAIILEATIELREVNRRLAELAVRESAAAALAATPEGHDDAATR